VGCGGAVTSAPRARAIAATQKRPLNKNAAIAHDRAMRRALVAVVVLAVGCDGKDKCGELAPGTTYQVTTLEVLSPQGVFPGSPIYNRGLPSCNARDGFRPGIAIKLLGTAWIEGRHCFYPLAQVGGYLPGEPADSHDVSAFFSDIGPEVPFYVGAKRVVLAGCPVTVVFGVEHTIDLATSALSPSVLAEPEPGALAPAALHRYLVPGGPGCEPCGDVYAAAVRVSP
jgi:hypothetical protein